MELGFGSLPVGIEAGANSKTTVSITDEVQVTVSFDPSSNTVAEGSTVGIVVRLSEAPGREVEIPITATPQGGADPTDYSGVPASLSFQGGDTEKVIHLTATRDELAESGEGVRLTFGALLPPGVTDGANREITVPHLRRWGDHYHVRRSWMQGQRSARYAPTGVRVQRRR